MDQTDDTIQSNVISRSLYSIGGQYIMEGIQFLTTGLDSYFFGYAIGQTTFNMKVIMDQEG